MVIIDYKMTSDIFLYKLIYYTIWGWWKCVNIGHDWSLRIRFVIEASNHSGINKIYFFHFDKVLHWTIARRLFFRYTQIFFSLMDEQALKKHEDYSWWYSFRGCSLQTTIIAHLYNWSVDSVVNYYALT